MTQVAVPRECRLVEHLDTDVTQIRECLRLGAATIASLMLEGGAELEAAASERAIAACGRISVAGLDARLILTVEQAPPPGEHRVHSRRADDRAVRHGQPFRVEDERARLRSP